MSEKSSKHKNSTYMHGIYHIVGNSDCQCKTKDTSPLEECQKCRHYGQIEYNDFFKFRSIKLNYTAFPIL